VVGFLYFSKVEALARLFWLFISGSPPENGMVEQKAGMDKPRLLRPYFTRSRSFSGGLFQRLLKNVDPVGFRQERDRQYPILF